MATKIDKDKTAVQFTNKDILENESKDKKNVLLVIGKTCSGKSYFVDAISKFSDIHKQIQCTDRPMRKDEIDGETYHFIETNEHTVYPPDVRTFDAAFGKVHYWTNFWEFADGINIIAGDPFMYPSYLKEFEDQLYIIYMIQSDGVRLSRYLDRDDGLDPIIRYNEIIRRFRRDDEDHYNFFNKYSNAKTIFIVGNVSTIGTDTYMSFLDVINAIKSILSGFKGSFVFPNGAIIQSSNVSVHGDIITADKFEINTNTGNFTLRENK